ncbi:nucleoporin NUP188 homolog [Pollicipes pollicipes]|uniref:nucleoporin NUP188 homolog n=1 Tax=Pollicipes pollicipes TaxID=41117 RepID=UPI001884F56A|nr:nucleoporin NUP188 homolog [Pollicipes pollicipes]
MLLEEQTHWDTGAGLEFIRLIHVALSVLNRLLMLRCRASSVGPEPSLLERLLTEQPAGRSQLRPVLAIAQYLFHRHNPHLPTLAIRLLLRLAKVFPMSLLASFGQDSDVICGVILTRLRSETEDVNLKVAILDFIATCVTSQPGLLQRLIGIGAIETEEGSKKKAEQDDEGGFLEELLIILKEHNDPDGRQSPLLLAAAALVHALWLGQCGSALTYLSGAEHFWSDLTAPLLSLVMDVTCSLSSDLNSSVDLTGQEEASEEKQDDGAKLLLAWCLVAAAPGEMVKLSTDSQQRLLLDLMTALERQLTADGRPRLVNTLSELVMTLAARWPERCAERAVQERCCSLLEACSARFEQVHVRARTAVLTTVLHTLQQSSGTAEQAVTSV